MVPKSVTKYSKKNGVTFISSVDRVQYTIEELTRAALKDVGKFVARETRKKIKKQTGRLAKNTQYWVRKKSLDLQIGFKPGGFYGGFQELGTEKTPKVGALSNSVHENIAMITKIESQYLSALEDEAKALALIDENEEVGADE
jgi:HK97 gp10 family phage protein